MILVCPSDPLDPRAVDAAFSAEANASTALGNPVVRVDHDALSAGREVVLRGARDARGLAVYRGWMLKPRQYGELFRALAERGIALINSPEQYVHCHHFPESYEAIAGFTPE